MNSNTSLKDFFHIDKTKETITGCLGLEEDSEDFDEKIQGLLRKHLTPILDSMKESSMEDINDLDVILNKPQFRNILEKQQENISGPRSYLHKPAPIVESLLETLSLEEVVVLATNYVGDLIIKEITKRIVPFSSAIFAAQVLNYVRVNKDLKDTNKLFIRMELNSLYDFISTEKKDSPERTTEIFDKIKKIESLL